MMRFLLPLLLAACATTGAAAPLTADAGERAAVMEAVLALTESWRTANPALADGVLHPEFRLTTLQGPPEDRHLHVVARDGLVSAAANLSANDWDDRLHDTEVRIRAPTLSTVTTVARLLAAACAAAKDEGG